MDRPPHLLIIWHSRTGASQALAQSAFDGAIQSSEDAAVLKRASEVSHVDLLEASGYLFICPENLASMSGEMKEMFDRSYYPVLGKIEGRPFATVIAAGSDGEGAQRQIDRIAKGWRLRRVSDPEIFNFNAQTPEQILDAKQLTDEQRKVSRELGAALAEGISAGIF